jgi:hypothetical protein
MPLSTGWQVNESVLYDKRKLRKFQHKSEKKPRFKYSIPILEPGAETSAKRLLPLIVGKKRRGWFKTGGSLKRLYYPCRIVSLLDDSGRWAGVLCLNEEKPVDKCVAKVKVFDDSVPCKPSTFWRSWNGKSEHVKPDTPYGHLLPALASPKGYELVALSADSARDYSYHYGSTTETYPEDESSFLDEWDLEERPKTSEFYEFYNVLWVQWKDRIAYRMALGRVLKEAWNRQAMERINITLG